MTNRPLSAVIGLACLAFPGMGNSQVLLRGMVVDSASMQALPNVNIAIITTGPGTVSDLRGYFELMANLEDTIVFSRVGYFTKILPARSVNQVVIIFLKEERRMLGVVEIKERRPAWLPEIPPESAWQNRTSGKSISETPGFQGVQSFGPGYVFRGVFSLLSKEQKKLIKVREENYRARNYASLVNDPEVKGRIMRDYLLSEQEYYDLLAKFNEKNKDIIYHLESHEVVALLILFFSENKPGK